MTCQNYNDVGSCPHIYLVKIIPMPVCIVFTANVCNNWSLFIYKDNKNNFQHFSMLLLILEWRTVQMTPQYLEMWFWNCCHFDQNECSWKIGLHFWAPILDKFWQKNYIQMTVRVYLDYCMSAKVWSFWPQNFTPFDKSRCSQKFWLQI